MMRLHARTLCLPANWWVLLSLFALSAAPVLAQDDAPPQPAGEQKEDLGPMAVEIDLQRLLFENKGGSTRDPVWRLSATSGKRILLIPFTVDNIHRTNKLSRFPVSVRTARFIGFVIPKPDQADRAGVDLNQLIRATPDALQAMLFEEGDDADTTAEGDGAGPDDDTTVPENAPRLAREIILHPDGTVQWSMSRSFHGATLQSASDRNLYGYKIDPDQLRKVQPERAERITRKDGEDPREFAERKREQQREEREKQTAYRELRNSLRELPEMFREARPGIFYAALEVSSDDTLSFEGPSPMPWVIDPEKRELFDDLARGRNIFEEEGGEDLAGRVVTMIESHPLDARSIAVATLRSNLAAEVEADSPGYEVISRLLQSKDVPTRRIALYGVASVTPPTLASAKLIGVAGEAVVGQERKMLSFASLGKLFSTQANDPANARTLIGQVSQAIADPQGPSAPRVIEKVLTALEPGKGRGGQRLDEATIDVMVKSVDLSGVEPEEVAGVVTAIIQAAPTNPVAAGWLDVQLLGSTRPEVVSQAMSLLDGSQVKPADPEGEEPEGAPAPKDADTIVLSGTIPMRRADHALLGLFESGDDLQKATAWAVLGRFHLALPAEEATGGGEDQPEDPNLMLLDSILAKANEREEVPASVVAFLSNQQAPALFGPANSRFIALATGPDLAPKAARAALDAYLLSPDRYREPVAALEPQGKQRLMEMMYRAGEQEPPLMAGMVADGGATLKWFNGWVTEQGGLPAAEDWAAMARSLGEGRLLQSAASADPVLAGAAAAALVVSAGGDPQQEQAFAQTVALMEARTRQQVSKQWDEQRNKIFASAFERAQGTYKLIASLSPFVSDDDGPGGDAAQGPAAETRVDLGLVEFRSQGIDLSLSVEAVTLSPTPGELGIRIDKAATLRSFGKPELAKLAPEHLSESIDLLPGSGGVWSGQMRLPDGRTLSVSLEPEG